jgi:hypothetical protein
MSTAIAQRVRQRGVALVETAICLPLLLFVMLAAGEVTNAFLQHNTLTKAVRDGARYAAGVGTMGTVRVALSANEISDTKNLVVYGNRAGTGSPALPNLTVAGVTVTEVGGQFIDVHATYAYTGILGSVLPSFGLGSDSSLSFNLEASVRMRAL